MKLPDGILRQHIAVLGKTGSGKSYCAKGIHAALLRVGAARVCEQAWVVDATRNRHVHAGRTQRAWTTHKTPQTALGDRAASVPSEKIGEPNDRD